MLTFKTASSKSSITRLRPLCVFNEEGRVLNLTGTPNYEYSLKDHLGNSRVTFDSSGGAVAKQTDDYYPFGMIAYQPSTPSPENKYLYNGKEIQRDLNDQYDYGARFYDPVIGRWTSVDPSAENDAAYSPYIYGFNNGIRFTDPDGRWPDGGCCDIKKYVQQLVNTARNISMFGSDAGNRAGKEAFKSTVNTVATLLKPIDDMNAGGHMKRGSAEYNALQQQGKEDVKAAIVTVAVALATNKLIDVGASVFNGTGPKPLPSTAPTTTNAPGFIVDGGGQAFPVPKGATGPTPVINSAGDQTGVAFTGGSGGANGQVSTMRIMNPTPPRGKSPGYPNGYIKYENNATPTPQAVDPTTGQTGSRATTHYPLTN